MPLEEYARKRKFSRTPEPAGAASAAAPAAHAVFCVQRHHARRLHYDLRMEVGGTLKSWAVPEGPTLDSGEKRLAVLVEDHPLEYASFEGNIPKGNYGAGSMMLWDRGTFEVLGGSTAGEQIARGDFKFRLSGVKLRGEFALVQMKASGKGSEWLLLKKKDGFCIAGWDANDYAWSVLTHRTQDEIAHNMTHWPQGAIQVPPPAKIVPMQAHSAAEPPAGEGWQFEIKLDGVRSLCFVDQGTTRLVSRKGLAMDRQYPEFANLHQHVAASSAILDAEIVALDEQGRPSFERLQPRIVSAATSSGAPVVLYVFDLIYLDGYDVRGCALRDRRRLLERILIPGERIRLSDSFTCTGKELLEAARANGLEGIVAKRAESFYEPVRSRDWLKIKIVHEQEFVICGWTEGGRDHFGALILGVFDQGRLTFAGTVGTGFTTSLMRSIRALLERFRAQKCAFSTVPQLLQPPVWVQPQLVCSVKFQNWTEEGRLRAPVFTGIRQDAEPRDCVRERDPEAAAPELIPRALLLPGPEAEATIEADGHSFRAKNLNKVFYPREGYTKRDLLNYYDAVSDLLVPHLRDRPLSLKRYPDGIESGHFFQKRAVSGFPAWVRTEPIPDDGEFRQQIVGSDRAALLYLVNLGCIDQNPWMSRVQTLDHPDFILIDLDPHECDYSKIVEAAQLVRRKLELLELESYPKTTGGDGMHIYIPLEPVYTYEQTKTFAEIVARVVSAERPALFTGPRPVSRREKGRVYFDHLQNGRGKTISAPYVPRAYSGAPVATPLEWKEVAAGLRPDVFTIRTVTDRFNTKGDLFAGVLKRPQRLERAMARLETVVQSLMG